MARNGAQAYREPRAWNSSELQLYNLSADPYERNNLLGAAGRATQMQLLTQARVGWLWRALQAHVNQTSIWTGGHVQTSNIVDHIRH